MASQKDRLTLTSDVKYIDSDRREREEQKDEKRKKLESVIFTNEGMV